MPRFYLPENQWENACWELDLEESVHCLKVLRLSVGDNCEVFDGKGRFAKTTILDRAGKRVLLARSDVEISPKMKVHVILGQSIPKGSNMDWIVQKAVELGVSEIYPLITKRTIARPSEVQSKQEKWQKVALEACKQCGQNYLPKVHLPMSFEEWMAKQEEISGVKLIASLTPEAKPLREIWENLRLETSRVTWLIGPEGDFSDEETNSAITKNFIPVSLGPITLRVETATFYCLAISSY